MTEDGTGVVRRQLLARAAEAYSSATLERVELATSEHLIFKHVPADGDWLSRATGGADRVRRLWESGLLGRIGDVVDHTVRGVQHVDGHDVVVIRDASEDLIPPAVSVPRATSRRLLAGLAELRARSRSEPVQPLCPIGARYAMFAPQLHAADPGPGRHPRRDTILAGWEVFAERVDGAVVEAVFAVHRDSGGLEDRLGRFPATLVHGDAKLENLGLGRHGLVAIDWGELTGFGPAEIDVAWYALKGSSRIGVTPDEVFGDYEAVAGRLLERDALDLACIGSLAQMGFRFAAALAGGDGPDAGAGAAVQLEWWVGRVRAALERAGLPGSTRASGGKREAGSGVRA